MRNAFLYIFLISFTLSSWAQISTGSTGGMPDTDEYPDLPREEIIPTPSVGSDNLVSKKKEPQDFEKYKQFIEEELFPLFNQLKNKDFKCAEKAKLEPVTKGLHDVLEISNQVELTFFIHQALEQRSGPLDLVRADQCKCEKENITKYYDCMALETELLKEIKDLIITNPFFNTYIEKFYFGKTKKEIDASYTSHFFTVYIQSLEKRINEK